MSSREILTTKTLSMVGDYIEKHYPVKVFCKRQNHTLYLLENPITKTYKIGITANLDRRIRDLSCAAGIDLLIMAYVVLEPGVDEPAIQIEGYLHDYFKSKRTVGEWFNLTKCDLKMIGTLLFTVDGLDYQYCKELENLILQNEQ